MGPFHLSIITITCDTCFFTDHREDHRKVLAIVPGPSNPGGNCQSLRLRTSVPQNNHKKVTVTRSSPQNNIDIDLKPSTFTFQLVITQLSLISKPPQKKTAHSLRAHYGMKYVTKRDHPNIYQERSIIFICALGAGTWPGKNALSKRTSKT